MRRSKKFSNRKRDKNMVLYFMCIVALVQIFYLLIRKKYTSLLFFCIVGLLLNLFIKNVSIVLLIDILVTNIMMRTVIRREGFEKSEDATTETPLETPTEKADKKTKLPSSPEAVNTTKPVTTSTTATTSTTPSSTTPSSTTSTTPAIESFTNNDKLQGVNKSIQMLSNLMDKFSSITGQLNYN